MHSRGHDDDMHMGKAQRAAARFGVNSVVTGTGGSGTAHLQAAEGYQGPGVLCQGTAACQACRLLLLCRHGTTGCTLQCDLHLSVGAQLGAAFGAGVQLVVDASLCAIFVRGWCIELDACIAS